MALEDSCRLPHQLITHRRKDVPRWMMRHIERQKGTKTERQEDEKAERREDENTERHKGMKTERHKCENPQRDGGGVRKARL
ncbi:MAG: hypothetical protein FD177_454 [Desulfovibrionaceae bacterium]|nr:MAG: hypothetical protein FD177_454 [Desulfovibrionaceae bacterium]